MAMTPQLPTPISFLTTQPGSSKPLKNRAFYTKAPSPTLIRHPPPQLSRPATDQAQERKPKSAKPSSQGGGSSKSGGGVFLPPVPLKEPVLGGMGLWPAVTAAYVKFEKEKVSVWPKNAAKE